MASAWHSWLSTGKKAAVSTVMLLSCILPKNVRNLNLFVISIHNNESKIHFGFLNIKKPEQTNKHIFIFVQIIWWPVILPSVRLAMRWRHLSDAACRVSRGRRRLVPLTVSSAAADTASTSVCTAHTYFPECFSWTFLTIRSPASPCPPQEVGKQETGSQQSKECDCSFRVKGLSFPEPTSPVGLKKFFFRVFLISYY